MVCVITHSLFESNNIYSFAMTEVAHGSNVRAIGTVAVYDKTTKEFVINTPDQGSVKFWIGNSAVYGTKAAVFCQLYTNSQCQGVHAILVPLRDPETMQVTPGITIKDCGVKQGWNGVDNGAIRFDHVRVPRENLLNKLGDVAEDGTYSSPISSEDKRFGETLTALMFGRLLYIMGPTKALEQGLTIAVRYALQRRQFGSSGKPENMIWSYPTHKDKIVPLIATANVYRAGWTSLALQFEGMKKEQLNELHAVISGVKAYVTENVTPALQILRACCGGHGYSEENRIGRLMNDMDVFMTAEGDSTILYQQLARYLITQYMKQMGTGSTAAIKFILQKTKVILTEKNPLTVRNKSEAHLRDSQFHLQAFTYRTGTLLHQAAMKLLENKKQYKDGVDAWNASLSELTELAKAYVHLELLKRSIQEIEQCGDKQVKQVFSLLSCIYAVHNIVQDMGFFRTDEYVKSGKARALINLLPKLYQEVDHFIPAIIDSYNIPDFLLKTPIGLSNKQYIPNTLEKVEMPLF
jgi:acyl-CoA oxidase